MSNASEQRESLKRTRLEYLYLADDETGLYPLLGSSLRALGKGWRLGIYTSARYSPIFSSLENLLIDPKNLIVNNSDDNLSMDHNYDLILIDGSVDKEKIKHLRDHFLGRSHVIVTGNDPLRDDYDLISRFSYQDLNPSGVLSFTGPGKGKSTSAFGVALLDCIQGRRTAIVQWFKEKKGIKGTWHINEHFFDEKMKASHLIEFHPTGLGFYGSPNLDRMKADDAYHRHKESALQGVELAKELIASGIYATVVLDEFIDTVAEIAQNIQYPLLDLAKVHEVLAYGHMYPNVQLVVTGRRVTAHWSEFIHRAYEIEEIRHPWSSKGKAAISGLDF